MQLQTQLVLPPAPEDQMGVGVHQTRRHQTARGVEDLRAFFVPGGHGSGAHLGDDAVAAQHPRVLQQLHGALLRALPGGGALRRGQHADVLYQ